MSVHPVTACHPPSLVWFHSFPYSMRLLTGLLLVLFTAAISRGAVVKWTGGASTSIWNDANNWNTTTVPGQDDDVLIVNVTVGCAVRKPAGQTVIRSLSIAAVCSLRLESFLNVTGPPRTNGPPEPLSVFGVLVMTEGGNLVASNTAIKQLYVRNAGTVLIL